MDKIVPTEAMVSGAIKWIERPSPLGGENEGGLLAIPTAASPPSFSFIASHQTEEEGGGGIRDDVSFRQKFGIHQDTSLPLFPLREKRVLLSAPYTQLHPFFRHPSSAAVASSSLSLSVCECV